MPTSPSISPRSNHPFPSQEFQDQIPHTYNCIDLVQKRPSIPYIMEL